MSANERIKWFHNKIKNNHYPNSFRIAEKFGISRSQASRDVMFLRNKIKAPILYDSSKKGYYYSKSFKLPQSIETANNDDYLNELSDALELNSARKNNIQMQIPYIATIQVKNKLAILELRSFIKEKINKNQYICEIRSVELFLCIIMSLNADIKIIEPLWLRQKLIDSATRVIKNNSEDKIS
jgi:predicted DNA-binding transcriptional regulator YafY